MKGTQLLRRIKLNSSTILTFLGAIGVVGTVVLAVSETPKAEALLQDATVEKGDLLTGIEKIKVAAPAYIPSIIAGTATITCIFGANVLNKRQQAALISAYGLLERGYKEYQDKVKELAGEDMDRQVREGIARDKFESNPPVRTGSSMCLFYEEHLGEYFERTMEEVLDAELNVNKCFVENGVVTLNDLFDFLGMDDVDGADLIGWESDSMIEFWGHTWINFDHRIGHLADGTEFYFIEPQIKPYSVL